MQLSLLIATRNNADNLARLLSALQAGLQPESWEAIVVDNGSTDHTSRVIKKFSSQLPLRSLYFADKGKSKALNAGLRQANGDVILFTDDDVVPDQYWLVNHVRAMASHPDAIMIGGRITVSQNSIPAWVANSYNLSGMLFSEHKPAEHAVRYMPNRYPYGPNMSVRKSKLIGVDRPWPEHLGPGTVLPVGDETGFARKLSVLSHQRLYIPDCVVEHRPVIPNQFFIKAVRRCFIGGYVAGRYTYDEDGEVNRQPVRSLAQSRLKACNSIREFCCVVSRAAGVGLGRFHGRFYPPFVSVDSVQ